MDTVLGNFAAPQRFDQTFMDANYLRVSSASVMTGFRNKLINPDFDIWQRGTSFALTAGSYVSDRWLALFAGSGYTVTHSRQPHVLGQTDVPGNPKYFHRVTNTTVGSMTASVLEQRIEGVQTLQAKRVTLTFYMKASVAFTLDTANSSIRQNFGTGGSPSSEVSTAFNTLTVSDTSVLTTWKKFTVSGTLPSITGKTLGSNGDDYLRIYFYLPITASLSIDISHVSIVEGDATAETDPCTPRSIQQEISLCQRFRLSVHHSAVGYASGAGIYARQTYNFATMRGTPTLTTANAVAANVTTHTVRALSNSSIQVDVTVTTTGQFVSELDIVLDAEL